MKDTDPSPITGQDAIHKEVVLRADRSRVWSAITDAKQFGSWFGVELDGPFEAGKSVQGTFQKSDCGSIACEFVVEAIEPMTLFSFRWHPFAVDPDYDYSTEPMTLVEFRLRDAGGATTHLTVTESGFGALPPARRNTAFPMNEGGWSIQVERVKAYVED